MQVTTGFGYFKDSNNNVVSKYEFPIGEHSDPSEGLTQVEVADQATLDAIVIYVAPLTAAQVFNVDQFCSDLLTAFAADANILPYYAIVKDLATFQNFSGMKVMALGLKSASKLNQTEIDTLTTILANQNIVWANL